MPLSHTRVALLLTALGTILNVPVSAQSGMSTPSRIDAAAADSFARAARARTRPSINAIRITTPPTIDGKLDEAIWGQGAAVTDFVQRELNEGVSGSERTEVHFATDGVNLYIGARMYDREPHLIVPGEKIRDVTLSNSDHIAFIFDTFHDHQNGFVFGTTPAGVEYDGQVIREGEGGGAQVAGQNRTQAGALGGFNVNWDGSWTVATSIDSLGWTAEFRIPFSTLRYQTGAELQTWGLNVTRSIRRKNEELYWSFIPRAFNLYRLSLAGNLANLTVPVRRIRTITPYLLSSSQSQWSKGLRTTRSRLKLVAKSNSASHRHSRSISHTILILRRSKSMTNASISRAFRCSFQRSDHSFLRMQASSQPAHRRPSTCFSHGASVSMPTAIRSQSSAAVGSLVG